MQGTLLDNTKHERVSNDVAAGTSVVNSDSVDTAGFDGVLFIISLGTVTTGPAADLVKAQQSSDDGAADAFTDIAGSGLGAVADTDDDKLLILDVRRPRERYVRAVMDRTGGNVVIDSITAVLYGPTEGPPAAGSDVSQQGATVGAESGTA